MLKRMAAAKTAESAMGIKRIEYVCCARRGILWAKLEVGPMKRFLPLLILGAAATAGAQKANPADYSTVVHVQGSHLFYLCQTPDLCSWWQQLEVTIDGKKYQLQNNVKGYELLRVGDYNAKIKSDETKAAYEYDRSYEFLFSDGKTRVYAVSGEEQ
jgi:hypothetical protein